VPGRPADPLVPDFLGDRLRLARLADRDGRVGPVSHSCRFGRDALACRRYPGD